MPSVGFPDDEHSTWDLPSPARHAYWNTVNLDELTCGLRRFNELIAQP